MNVLRTPTSCSSDEQPDGTCIVTYRADGEVIDTVTYPTRRDYSIESTLRMFPGTSREWVERMHAPDPYAAYRIRTRDLVR